MLRLLWGNRIKVEQDNQENEMTKKQIDGFRVQLGEALLAGDAAQGIQITKEGLAAGISPSEFFLQVIQPELYEIGKKFERLDIFLPELMNSAVVIKSIQSDVLDDAIQRDQSGEAVKAGKVVIGTVQGDIHDIGKNMVALMLQVNGFDVVDLGTDVSAKQFIKAAKDNNADIIGMSSLLTTSMPYMSDLIERLDALELRDQYKVIVGGAPLTPEHSQNIGADVYGADAVAAVNECSKLIAKQ